MRLSVIVAIVAGRDALRRCLTHLDRQIDPASMEVLVPYDTEAPGAAECRDAFPRVRFLDGGMRQTVAPPHTCAARHERFDRRIAAGLAAARGEIVAILQDTERPAPDWVAEILDAHALPHGVIGGAIEHEGATGLEWAVYFQDFARYQLPLAEGPSPYVSDVNVSYKRAVLDAIADLWRHRYKEAEIHWALADRGVTLWIRPQVVVFQNRGRLTLAQQIVERYAWGRLFGAMRARRFSPAMRWTYAVLSPLIPIVLIGRVARKLIGSRRTLDAFLRALPWMVVTTSCWAAGEAMAYATGREVSLPDSGKP